MDIGVFQFTILFLSFSCPIYISLPPQKPLYPTMPRKSALYFNQTLNQYSSTIKGKKHYFGADLASAQVKFEAILSGSLKTDNQEEEPPAYKSITLQQLVNKFIKHKKQTNAADNTILWYEGHLNTFIGFIGPTKKADSINLALVQQFVSTICKKRDYSLNTEKGLKRAIRSLFAYATEETNLLLINPVKSRKFAVGSYSKSEAIPIPTDEEVKKAIAYFETRNPALCDLIKFLYHSGSRLSEARNIKLKDIDINRKRINLGKAESKQYRTTGKKRTIYLSDKVLEIVARNMKDKEAGDYLFINPTANSQSRQWIPNSARSHCRRAKDKLGFLLNLRGIRHVAITNLILAGVDLLSISKLVGHANLTMIQKFYEELNAEHLIDTANKI